ncbi:MAG: hypothetical protein VX438_07030 [Planctomycetota bacterium]|nr:hypothetical protein [Planctomycetota bacterium]
MSTLDRFLTLHPTNAFCLMLSLVFTSFGLVQPNAAGDELTMADLFPTDRLIQVHITLKKADWDKIRQETRTFFSALDESRKTSPPESPYTYVDASVVIDGVQFPHVSVRKKVLLAPKVQSDHH